VVRLPQKRLQQPEGYEEQEPEEVRPTQRSRKVREMFSSSGSQALIAIAEEPLTLQEALATEDGLTWKQAWESELKSLRKNNTWVICRSPKDREIVGC